MKSRAEGGLFYGPVRENSMEQSWGLYLFGRLLRFDFVLLGLV